LNHAVRKVIAALQLAGGFAGLWLTSTSSIALLPRLLPVIIVGLLGLPYLLSLHAGRLLWLGRREGLWWSLALQLLQCFMLSTPAFLYTFVSGCLLGFWITPGGLRPIAFLGSHAELNWAHQDRVTAIGVNLIAAWCVYQLTAALARKDGVQPAAAPPAPA
jgi:hypothetical protein